MEIIDGRGLAAEIQKEVKDEIARLGITPGLAVILVGDNPASQLYVALKEAAAKEVGIRFEKHAFIGTEPQEEIMARIQALNEREDIHGMIVQVPLSKNYDADVVISQMDPKKDADGFHQVNLRAILSGKPRIISAVALAIVALIDEACSRSAMLQHRSGDPKGSHYMPLKNHKAVLLANRTEFAAPVEYLLKQRGASVHLLLRQKEMTAEAIAHLRDSDVVVIARGRANFITGDMLKDGAIVIDVGTNKLPDGRVVGDVNFSAEGGSASGGETLRNKPGFITPVPGGVGPMTVAMLLKNTLELCKCSSGLQT